MRRLTVLLALLMAASVAGASNGFDVNYESPAQGVHQLDFDLGEYGLSTVTLGDQTFTRIDFGGSVRTVRQGFAELPYIHAAVRIDEKRNVHAIVLPGEYVDIPLDHPLLPSRGVIYRDQDPSLIPYTIDPKSVTDTWYPVDLATSTEPYILRDIRGTNVYVYPFRYNAARQVLRVYTQVTVRLVENDTPSLNPLERRSQVVLREMDAIYRDVFINYDVSASRDDLTIGETGDILVITTDRDVVAIQPYIDWKTEKGYYVDLEVVAAGTIVNSLVQDAYDANNDLLYVLLVGDWADIKCNTLSSGAPMDPQVGCVVGTDQYPDITVGRFSANSPADVTVQVNKVIQYEKLPEAGGTWYSAATGIASAEGAGIGDDNESDIQHNDVIWNDKLDSFTFDTFTDIYDPGASASEVAAAVNAGTSVINYTGHGYAQGWGTTGFSNSHVANLTNGERMPWIVSVACNNGDFHTGTCFGEAWLRKENGGAIMMMAASISQPWTPPMRGQDYFMDVLIGGYDYTAHPGQSGINTAEQRTTFGAVTFNGLVLMCVESGGGSDWETAKTWNLFGDPATQARTAAPADLTLSSTLVMVGIPFTTNISTSEGPVENAMVALSQGGAMFRGFTDASGNVSMEHTLTPGTARLVVTGFNTETIYEEVTVVPADGAYVLFASCEINDAAGNANGMLDYAETVYLTVGLTNVGTEDADGVEAILGTGSIYVSLIDTLGVFGTIPAGDTVYITDVFELSVADSVPDGQNIGFLLDITGSGGDNWSSGFGLQAHAPELEFLGSAIIDTLGNNNGRLDPDETAEIQVMVGNAGSSDAYNVLGDLFTDNEYLTLGGDTATFGDLMPGDTGNYSFQVTVSPDVPPGDLASFTLDVTADHNIMTLGEFQLYIGQIPVLVLNLDGNDNSAPVIQQCLENLQVGSENADAMPENLGLYTSIFVCLGVYPDNHVMTEAEGQELADYLNAGGQIYMEGGDTWYYDQQYTPTPVHGMFGLRGEEDGSGDLSTLMGMEGSMAEGMEYDYSGDNSYIDHILPDGGEMMFENMIPAYGGAVSYDGGNYRTIGSSFEFGGLQDGDHSKDDLMIHILEFFGIEGIWTSVDDRAGTGSVSATVYPNPATAQSVVRFTSDRDAMTSLVLFNMNGQEVYRVFEGNLSQGTHHIPLESMVSGSSLPQGVYFLRLQAGDAISTLKVVLAK